MTSDEPVAKKLCQSTDMPESSSSSTNLLLELYQKRKTKLTPKSPIMSPSTSPPIQDTATEADWSNAQQKCLQMIKLSSTVNSSISELEKNRQTSTASKAAKETAHQMRSDAKTFKLKVNNEKYNEEKAHLFDANLKRGSSESTQQERELTLRVEAMDDEINELYQANYRFQVQGLNTS